MNHNLTSHKRCSATDVLATVDVSVYRDVIGTLGGIYVPRDPELYRASCIAKEGVKFALREK